MSKQTKPSYEVLSAISVKDKVERKGRMDYLSWANAWHMLKQQYPSAQRIVYEDPATGWNYFSDGRSSWVKVGIVVNDVEHIDYLPIMDFRNKAIGADEVTSMDVNKTIQRSTAKAIAMHGLGLSLWKGEDVPEMVTKAEPVKKMGLKVGDSNWEKVKRYVLQNKGSLNIDEIVVNLSKKYTINATNKKELQKLLK
jgi:hypothetical protein